MQLNTLLVFAHSGEDPSTAKLRYTIVYNSSRALRFQQIYVGSLNKPDGRTGNMPSLNVFGFQYLFTVYLELQRQVDQFFMSQVLGRDIVIDVSTKDYPKIYLRVSTETQEVVLVVNTLGMLVEGVFVYIVF